jgi:hypothetical protein
MNAAKTIGFDTDFIAVNWHGIVFKFMSVGNSISNYYK